MCISEVTSTYRTYLQPLHMYHGMLVWPYHVDLVFQCLPAGEPNIPSHASYSILKYSNGNAQKTSVKMQPHGRLSEQWKHVCQVRNWYLKYKDGLKSFASTAIFFISVKKARSLLFITPVQCQSKWKVVRTCGSNSVLLPSA